MESGYTVFHIKAEPPNHPVILMGNAPAVALPYQSPGTPGETTAIINGIRIYARQEPEEGPSASPNTRALRFMRWLEPVEVVEPERAASVPDAEATVDAEESDAGFGHPELAEGLRKKYLAEPVADEQRSGPGWSEFWFGLKVAAWVGVVITVAVGGWQVVG